MENNEKEREIITTEEDMDKNNNEDRRYYIYEHIRKDNNTCFYVGKGTGDRAYKLDRGEFHDKVRDKYGCIVKIIKDGLTEKEAFALERERIADYVITFGWGAPIDGYRDYSNNYLTNFTWGGEGCSGINPWNKGKKGIFHHTEETKEKMSEAHKGKKQSEEHNKKISEARKGEKNPMFGKNAYANKTPEEMEEISKKKSEAMKGEKHPNAKKVICITTGKIFDCIKYAVKYYKCSSISACCRGVRKSAGELNGVLLQWKYLKDYNNEFKGILINPIIK